MEKTLQDGICDTTCMGTGAELHLVKDNLVDNATALVDNATASDVASVQGARRSDASQVFSCTAAVRTVRSRPDGRARNGPVRRVASTAHSPQYAHREEKKGRQNGTRTFTARGGFGVERLQEARSAAMPEPEV